MSQEITITIDGNDGVAPDSAGIIFRAVFSLLRSIDIRGWAVGAERINWRITEARLVNPLVLTATGEGKQPNIGGDNLAIELINYLQEIDKGNRPRIFADKDLKLVKEIGQQGKQSRSLTLTGAHNGRQESLTIGNQFYKRISRLIRSPRVMRCEYNSIEGTLIKLVNDPLRTDASAILRERHFGTEVSCHAQPDTASKMAKYVNRQTRIVMYGTITYEDETPRKIEVEDFQPIESDDLLPTLETIHSMGFHLPNGMDVDDYLNDIRGEGDEQ